MANSAQPDLHHTRRGKIVTRFESPGRYNSRSERSGMDTEMIGTLLRQLILALRQWTRYQTLRILKRLEERVAAPAAPTAPNAVAGAMEPTMVCTATDASIAALSDEVGLDPDYRRPVQWPCHRSDVLPPEVLSDPLYQLWRTIPQGLKWTQYFPVYEAIFAPIRTSPLRILEIGIWQGSSLQLWRRYFDHPQTILVGIDVLPECRRFDAPDHGVHIRIGSQADAGFLQKVAGEFGPFDLIIDDGSHHSSHIITSFNHLFAGALKDTGIYFVEDLHANYWHPWRDTRRSFLDVCKEMLEHMHAHYRGSSPIDFLTERPSARHTTSIEVPRITTMIREMRFFDSMVAIYKANLAYVPYYLASDA